MRSRSTRRKGIEPPETFDSVAEAERHFRQTHLPALMRTAPELTISGVVSRRLPDRGLGRVIEDAWSAEIRSPSKMMAELAGALRGAGLNIFRHRRGMLFVSPIRIRTFGHERSGVSVSINAILEKLAESPGLTRKQLAEKLVPAEGDAAAADRVKLGLGSDLRWLISEGYVIEFNDGTLDMPRAKPSEVKADGERGSRLSPAPTDADVTPATPPQATDQTAGSDRRERNDWHVRRAIDRARWRCRQRSERRTVTGACCGRSAAGAAGRASGRGSAETLREGAVPSPS